MKIAFDVDDTLYRIRIRNIGGRPVQDQVPDLDLIRVLRWFHQNGDLIFVWSTGGVRYAQRIVEKFGLTGLVTVIPKHDDPMNRMDLVFDDEPVNLGLVNCRVRRPDHY